MKKLLILLFSLIISLNSYGEWSKVSNNTNGTSFYVDIDRIKNQGPYVYYWELMDLLKPNSSGTLSAKSYIQGECNLVRYRIWSYSFYKTNMGQGRSFSSSNIPDKDWRYPFPNSSAEAILEIVCN